MPVDFNPKEFKEKVRQRWNNSATAWLKWAPTLRDSFGPATDQMLKQAGVKPGLRVLDIAAGTGDQSLMAARIVGSEGFVLATDIATEMLQVAKAELKSQELNNIEIREMDAENLSLADESFDCAISRLGIMFLPDPHKCLRDTLRILKTGGRFAVIVYSTEDTIPFLMECDKVIREYTKEPKPAPDQPSGTRFGPPGVLEKLFSDCGYSNIEITPVQFTTRFENALEATRFRRDVAGAKFASVAKLSKEQVEELWAKVTEAIRQFETESGFCAPGEVLVGSGVKG